MRTQNINHALPNGSRLDNYEIIESIGSGGFGITYKALDTSLKHIVAIKEYLPVHLAWRADESTVIPRTDSDTESFEYGLEQFIEEGRTLARFKHTNIVRVIRYFKENGTAYLVMEYEHGETLKEFLLKHPRPDESTLLELMTSILKGLKAIHDQGFLHRDIKPSNIYLRNEGEPLLIDFGSARQALTRQTQSLTGIVTEGFAPFEQYTGNIQQTAATDLYGLGATLYHALSNKPPMNALDRFNSLHVSSSDPLVPSTQAGASIYNHFFLSIVDWLLEIYPENRPQTVGAVIEALNNQDMPDLTRTQLNTRIHHDIKPNKSTGWNRSILLLTGTIATLSLVVAITYWNISPSKPATTPPLSTDMGTNNITNTNEVSNPFSKDKNRGVHYITELRVVKGGDYFQIESIPSQAKIYINGTFRGITPYVFVKPSKDDYTVTLKKPGYLSSKRLIHKKLGYSYLLKPTLKKLNEKPTKKYSFSVDVSPQNARVEFLDSNLKYDDNMELPIGQYKIKVSAPNHQAIIKKFKLEYANRTLKIFLSHNKLLRTQTFNHWIERIIKVNNQSAIIVLRRGNARLLNIDSGQVSQQFSESSADKTGISHAPLRLFTAKSGRYQLWDIIKGQNIASKKTNDNFTSPVLFSPEGTGWVKANYEKRQLLFYTFSQFPKITKTLMLTRPINKLFEYSNNRKTLLASEYGNTADLFIINLETNKITTVLKGYNWTIKSANFTPDGTKVVSMTDDGKLRLWSLKTKKPIWTSGEKFFAYTTLAVSQDGRYAATASNYESILIWELSSGKVIANLAGHTDSITTLAFFANNSKLVSGSRDKTLRIWDISGLTKQGAQQTKTRL